MQESSTPNVKTAAKQAIDALPDNATWDDVMYRMFVRQKIDAGLADAEAGNLISTEEVRKRLGLPDAG